MRRTDRQPLINIDRAAFYARDEWHTGRRTMLETDDDSDDPGAWLTIIDTDHDYRSVHLELWDIELLAEKLAGIAERQKRSLCPFCDSLGMVDGPDGPEFCEHNFDDA